jgi:hypothetical protein
LISNFNYFSYFEVGLWCLTLLSTIFQLYHSGQFFGGGNRITRRNPLLPWLSEWWPWRCFTTKFSCLFHTEIKKSKYEYIILLSLYSILFISNGQNNSDSVNEGYGGILPLTQWYELKGSTTRLMTVLQLTATKRRCIYIYSLVYGALQKIKI